MDSLQRKEKERGYVFKVSETVHYGGIKAIVQEKIT